MMRVLLLVAVLGCATGAAGAQEADRFTLERAVRLALASAPALAAAGNAREAALAGVREARAAWLPQVGGEASVTRFAEPMVVAPLHGFTPDRIPAFDRTLLQGSLALGYTVFDGGERGGQVARARAVEGMAGADYAAAAQHVIVGTVRAYVEVLAASGQVDAHRRREEALVAELNRAERFLVEGRAAPVEVLRAQAGLAQARAELASAQSRLDIAEAELARWTAVEVERVRAARLAPVARVTDRADDREALLALARQRHPALQAVRSRVAAAEAALRLASAAWFPAIRFEGRLVSYGAAEARGSTEWQTGLRLHWPIFTGGRRAAAVARARAVLAEAEAALHEADRAVASRLDRSLAAVLEADRRAEALASAVAQWTEVVRVEALALGQGAGTQAEYLRAEAELAAVTAGLVQARGAQVAARVELAQATGGLTLDTLSRLLHREP